MAQTQPISTPILKPTSVASTMPSDDTVKAFLSVPDDKKREALAKMKPETKQGLLTGLKAYKEKNPTTQTPAQAPPVVKPVTPNLPTTPVNLTQPNKATEFVGSEIHEGAHAVFHNLEGIATTLFGRRGINQPAQGGMPAINIPQAGTPISFHDIEESTRGMQQSIIESAKKGDVPATIAKSALALAPIIAAVGTGGNPLAAAAMIPVVSPWLVSSYDKAASGHPISAAIEVGGTIGLPHAAMKAAPKLANFGTAAVRWNQTVEDASKVRYDSFSTSKGATLKGLGDAKKKIGALVKDIADEDSVQSANAGLKGSFDPGTLGKFLDQTKKSVGGGKLTDKELPGVAKAAKYISDRTKSGPMSWNDLKQLRTSIHSLDAKGVDGAILAKLDESIKSSLEKRATDINRGSQYKAYQVITKALDGHNNGLMGQLISASTDQEFFDILKKNSKTEVLKQLDHDMSAMGMPDSYFQRLYDSHTKIHQVVTNARKGSVMGKVNALRQHPIMAGSAAMGAYAVSPGFGAKLVASLIATSYAAEWADKAEAVGEMKKLPKNAPAKGLFEQALQVTPAGPSQLNPPAAPPTPPPSTTPLGMAPGPNQPVAPNPTPTPTAVPAGGAAPKSPTAPVAAPPPATPAPPTSAAMSNPAASPQSAPSVSKSAPAAPKTVSLSEHIIQEGTAEAVRINKSISNEAKETQVKKETKTPAVTKAAPEATGRESSARPGMTKDTKLARNNKAAERTAKNRAENISAKADASKTGADDSGQKVPMTDPRKAVNRIDLEDWVKETKGKAMSNMLTKALKGYAEKLSGKSSGPEFDSLYDEALKDAVLKMYEGKGPKN